MVYIAAQRYSISYNSCYFMVIPCHTDSSLFAVDIASLRSASPLRHRPRSRREPRLSPRLQLVDLRLEGVHGICLGLASPQRRSTQRTVGRLTRSRHTRLRVINSRPQQASERSTSLCVRLCMWLVCVMSTEHMHATPKMFGCLVDRVTWQAKQLLVARELCLAPR